MDVYVATKAENHLLARQVMDCIEQAGHDITHDWTPQVRENPADNPMLNRQQQADFARGDLQGVKDADVLVLIPHERITGALIEVGAALASGSKVFVLGEPTRHTVFFALPQVTVFPDPFTAISKMLKALDELQDHEMTLQTEVPEPMNPRELRGMTNLVNENYTKSLAEDELPKAPCPQTFPLPEPVEIKAGCWYWAGLEDGVPFVTPILERYSDPKPSYGRYFRANHDSTILRVRFHEGTLNVGP